MLSKMHLLGVGTARCWHACYDGFFRFCCGDGGGCGNCNVDIAVDAIRLVSVFCCVTGQCTAVYLTDPV